MFDMLGVVGESFKFIGKGGDYMVEFFDFCLMNVEMVMDVFGKQDVCGVGKKGGVESGLCVEFGNVIKMMCDCDLCNVGFLVQYKLCDVNGQVYEFSNYMQLVMLDGQLVFLVGMCLQLDELFCYLCIFVDV